MFAKIYRIHSDKGEKVYIGSTTDRYLCNRFSDHRTEYRAKRQYCTSHILFDEYGMDNCFIELIEEVEYKTKDDYHIREQYWIDNTPTAVNTKPAYQTPEQKRIISLNKRKLYYKRHADAINEKRKTNLVTCECGMEVRADWLTQHKKKQDHLVRMGEMVKEYVSEEHKKELACKRNAKYYETHKAKIAEKAKEKGKETMVCECGVEIAKVYHTRHLKTKKHLAWAESQ